MLLRKSNKAAPEKAPKVKPVKAAKEKPVKVAKEKPAKATKTPKAPKPKGPKVVYKPDVYTLMLLLSFVALLTACIFLYINVSFDAQNM